MLCDDLAAGGAPGSGMDVGGVIKRIGKAHKFVLSAEFAAVADALSEDYTGLVRAFDHCRLPYPETWIEVAHQDRPRFREAPMHAPAFQNTPRRVGFLLTATRPDLSAWKAHLLWAMPNGECSAAAMATKFDMTVPLLPESTVLPTPEEEQAAASLKGMMGIIENGYAAHPGWTHASDSVKLMMIKHTQPTLADYDFPLPVGIPRERWGEFFEGICELSRADWAGEPSFLLAVIGLLNARNAVDAHPSDLGKLNKARVKRGHRPLFEHKVLKIAARQVKRIYGDGRGAPDHASMRQHFCRGHFKARKSGIFFWSPHLRGDPSRGKIEKEYHL